MTARCWKCGDNRPCDLQFCGLKEDDAMITSEHPNITGNHTVLRYFKGYTMTTLPTISENELIELWQASDPHAPDANERFALAIISARDAQWQAAVDAAVMAERERWTGVIEYLTAAADGSMSRNNSKQLADELLVQIRARTKEKT